ncbi:hypothetical protein GCG21_10965 [Pseudactinotalea sp. HY160]|uniref:hypothetical protein n=1 Tax=Pseudactinotalea sp. HY160 TaxID=2654490 RepID=UPI00128BABF4|nr:hypothetical protein [Pseudactinotalea sp. HY160]MPV50515.1 hypothetical protein [Pseudactinotalea sp. HY160]
MLNSRLGELVSALALASLAISAPAVGKSSSDASVGFTSAFSEVEAAGGSVVVDDEGSVRLRVEGSLDLLLVSDAAVQGTEEGGLKVELDGIEPDSTLVVMPDVPKADVLAYVSDALGGATPEPNPESGPASEPFATLQYGCGSSRTFTATVGMTSWGNAINLGCSIAGSPGHKTTYAWQVNPSSYGSACVAVAGWVTTQGAPGQPPVTVQHFYPAGCGNSSAGLVGYTVPWGNVWAIPKFKVRNPGTVGVTGVVMG